MTLWETGVPPPQKYPGGMMDVLNMQVPPPCRITIVKNQSLAHEVLCKRLKAKKVILHTILPGVGGSIYTSHTLSHFKELGLDAQKTHKTALKLHARSVLYAHKVTTT